MEEKVGKEVTSARASFADVFFCLSFGWGFYHFCVFCSFSPHRLVENIPVIWRAGQGGGVVVFARGGGGGYLLNCT